MHVNAREHLRVLVRALGIELDDNIIDFFAALLQDVKHIERGAPSGSNQHELHGARSGSPPVRPEGGPENDLVPGSGLADECAVLNPFDTRLHQCHPSVNSNYHSASRLGTSENWRWGRISGPP